MAKIYRYPALVMESPPGFFTAILLDEGYPAASGTDPDAVLLQLREHLVRQDESGVILKQPDYLEPRVLEVHIPVCPEYRRGHKSFPCSEKLIIPVTCVHGREEGGMFTALLPTVDRRFQYYEKGSLKTLAAHFARDKLSGKEPLELALLLPLESRFLGEVKVPVKGRKKKFRRSNWFEDKTIENLAGAAEPLTAGGVRGRYLRACRREAEVETLLEHLRARQAGIILVGEPGVGKTTVLAEAGRRLERETRKKNRRSGFRLWSTSAHRIIAGMRFLGQWEERCEELIRELASLDGTLCVDSLLDLVRTGGQGPVDSIAAFFAPYLRQGRLRLVAESTPDELDACRRLLPGFAEQFQIVRLEPFAGADARGVLEEMAAIVSRDLRLEAEPSVPPMLHRLFSRFDPYAAFPGRAVSFLIDSFDRAADQRKKTLTGEAVLKAFARRSGLPEVFLRDDLTLDRNEALGFFRSRIIGQDPACAAAADVVTRFKAGMNDPGRPVSVLIFCGPTGVGKTALTRALSDYFFGGGDDSDRLVRLDMSEYGGPDGAERLITGPDGGQSDFIKRVRRQPFSLVLLDEIEKAHPRVFDALMNVFDEGRLSDPFGRVTNFRSAIIVMTSNLGASRTGSLGFGETAPIYEDEVMNFFRPEFFNRIDGVVTFSPLGEEVIRKIAEKELGELAGREGLRARGLKISWSQEVVEHIAKTGFDARYGARPLQRTVESIVVTPVARLLAALPETRDRTLRLEMDKEDRLNVSIQQ